jgi:hypothetical protein
LTFFSGVSQTLHDLVGETPNRQESAVVSVAKRITATFFLIQDLFSLSGGTAGRGQTPAPKRHNDFATAKALANCSGFS